MGGRDEIISRGAVENLIAEGHTIVVLKDNVLRLDSKLNNHTGGNLAILHMVFFNY